MITTMTSERLDAATKPAASELQSGSELCSSALLARPARIVALSGGKDSTAMAIELSEHEPNPDYQFCITPT